MPVKQWLGRFDSDAGSQIRSVSSVEEQLLYTEKVGSSTLSRTTIIGGSSGLRVSLARKLSRRVRLSRPPPICRVSVTVARRPPTPQAWVRLLHPSPVWPCRSLVRSLVCLTSSGGFDPHHGRHIIGDVCIRSGYGTVCKTGLCGFDSHHPLQLMVR